MNPDYSQRLEEFNEYLKKIPEIIAVYYTGSTASKKWDKYSDLDIDLIVKDKDYDKVKKMLPKLLSWWGKIKLCNKYPWCDEVYAFVDDYFKVEIDPIKLSSLKPAWELNKIRIAYDNDETLTKAYNASKKIRAPAMPHQDIVNRFLQQRDNQFYVARHFMRGRHFSALREVEGLAWDIFWILAKVKGMEDYELIRTFEKNVTIQEKNLFNEAAIIPRDKLQLKKALKANWDFMRYTEKLYEKNTGKKLSLKCNDKEILNKISGIFEGK